MRKYLLIISLLLLTSILPMRVWALTATASPTTGLVTMTGTDNITTSRPTLYWTLSGTAGQPGAAANATRFRVYVAPANNVGAPIYHEWITRTNACGSSVGTACSFALPIDLIDGITYSGFVQSGTSNSLTTSGGFYNNGYAGPLNFAIDIPNPDLPINVAITFDNGLPVMRWYIDPNATSFNVYIGTYPYWGYVFFQNVPVSSLTCDPLDPYYCTYRPLVVMPNGIYNFAVQTISAGGASLGSTYNNGYSVVENLQLNLPVPLAPLFDLAPTATVATGKPTFTWATVANAISYQLWVGKVTPFTTFHQQWYWAVAPNCTPHPGTCSISPDLNLPIGTYAWNVQAYGPGGLGPWTDAKIGIPFTIQAALPGMVALTSPNGTITDTTPAFIWSEVAGADWYNVWIGNPAVTVAYHYQWYRQAAACSAGTCSLEVPGLILPVGNYLWNVQAANPAGIGAWTPTGLAFVVAPFVVPTATFYPSVTPSNTPSPIFTAPPTNTPIPTRTRPPATFTNTPAPSPTPSHTPIPTPTWTASPTRTLIPSPTNTRPPATFTNTPGPSPTPSPTTYTFTPSPTPIPTQTQEPSPTPSNTPSEP